MKIIRRLLSILAACLFLVFALVAVGTALHVMSVPTLATLLLSISLFATALVIVRTSVWLWRSAAFWHVGYKRAEVCTVPALVLGLLAAMYYTPATDDPNAITKFMIAAQIPAGRPHRKWPHHLTEAAAVDCVSKWRFTPAKLKGHPVATRMVVAIRFVPRWRRHAPTARAGACLRSMTPGRLLMY